MNDVAAARDWRVCRHAIAAFLVAAIAIGALAAAMGTRYPVLDELTYISVAVDIYEHGIYGDGNFAPRAAVRNGPIPGQFFAPLYPGLIAGLMAIDSRFADEVQCVFAAYKRDVPPECGKRYTALVVTQTLLAAATCLFLWLAARLVTGSLVVSWLALAVAISAGAYSAYAIRFLTEGLAFTVFSAASLALLVAWRGGGRWGRWAWAGAALGVAALTRPSYAYVLYAALPAAALALPLLKNVGRGRMALSVGALAVGYLLVAGPWMARNHALFGDWGITGGYASFILVERIAYNAMTWGEWGAAFVYWLPDFGDSLAASLFDPALVARLNIESPAGFSELGKSVLRAETLAAAGGREAHLGYLIREGILADPIKHLAVTLALAWRGVWIAKYWGLVTVLLFVPVLVVAIRRRWDDFILYALPAWFMVGFHGFTSVSIDRYNLTLIPPLSIAAAWAIHAASGRMAGALRRGRPSA